MTRRTNTPGFRRTLLRLFGLLGLFLLVACGQSGSSSPAIVEPTRLTDLEISPASPNLAAGTALTLQATGLYSDGSHRELDHRVSWESSAPSVATVAGDGRVSGLSAGQTAIRASLDGLSTTVTLRITAATLDQLVIEPPAPRLAKGTQLAATAFGLFSDGSRQVLTDQVSWISLADSLFSVATDGRLTALAAGSGELQASLGGLTRRVTVEVSEAELTALHAIPAAATLPAGTALTLRLEGLYSDGGRQALTTLDSWQSDAPAIASVYGDTLRGLTPGNATLHATYGGLSLDLPVQVTNAVLTRIELDVGDDTLPAGLQRTLRALGHFSDGGLQDITAAVTWHSTDESRLLVTNAAGHEGLATALAAGSVTISATLGEVVAQATLAISPASLQTLELEPSNPRLAAGTGLSLHAFGRYADGSLQELTQQVVWSSDDPAIAGVGNDAGQAGVVTGLVAGETTLRARLGEIAAGVPLQVSAAQLAAITIEPAEVVLASGGRLDLHAVGSFSDGSTQLLGEAVRWESVATEIASVDDDGRVHALAAGSGRIIASLNGVAGSIPLTVTDAVLQTLEIDSPATTLADGTEIDFHALAVYSDGSRRDVTAQTVWSSEDPAVLQIDNDPAGAARAVAQGSTAVLAHFGGLQQRLPVTVSAAVLSALRIDPAVNGLASGESVRLSAIADFSDGSHQTLERGVVWRSSDPDLASVSNSDDSRGLVTAAGDRGGDVAISAEYGGLSASQTLTISLDPQRPVSLVVLPDPNLLHNDDLDTSRISLRLQAADPTATVSDGTLVSVVVSQDGQTLFTTTVTTSGGEAVFDFTTTVRGLLLVEATVSGSTVSGRGLIYASDQPLEVVAPAAFADAQRSDGVVQAGARFGFFLFNTSNRPIPLHAFSLTNGSSTLLSINDPTELNNGWLDGGMQLGFVVTLGEALPDQGLRASFILADPANDQAASLSVVYSQPQ